VTGRHEKLAEGVSPSTTKILCCAVDEERRHDEAERVGDEDEGGDSIAGVVMSAVMVVSNLVAV